MVDFWSKSDIILQPVVAYNHHDTMCRVEGAIGCSKQHSRVALVCTNAPACFWPDATDDFTWKKKSVGKMWRTWWVVNCQQSHATCLCRLIQNCWHTFWVSCDKIFTSRISFGQERILRRSFCWSYLPSCRPRHAVYSHVLNHLRIWTPCPGFQITPQRISFSKSLVPTTVHSSHFTMFGWNAWWRCSWRQPSSMGTALHAHTRTQTRATNAAMVIDDPIIRTTSADD